MKNNRGLLPIPFLILILAGVVSLFSILTDRGSRASMVRDDSLQMQTIEQEHMAEFYFRILSWLSDLTPRSTHPVKANPQPPPTPQIIKSPQRHERPGRIELCRLPFVQILAASKHRVCSIN